MRYFLMALGFFSTAQAGDLASYLNIYQDTQAELQLDVEAQEDEILYQRIVSPYFPEIERSLTDAEERELIETGVTTALTTRVTGTTARQQVLDRYDFEKWVYGFEKKMITDLEREQSSSNENPDDDTFDLVDDLNQLDQLLFGSQAKTSQPQFAETGKDLSTDPEAWQVGDPRSAQDTSGGAATSGGAVDAFPEGENSLIGAVEDLLNFISELNAKPLNSEIPARQLFSPGQTVNNTDKRVDLEQTTVKTPGALIQDPEIFDLPTDSLKALSQPLQERIVATDNRDYLSGLTKLTAAFSSQNIQKSLSDSAYKSQVDSLQRGGQTYQQNQDLEAQDKLLQHWTQHLLAMTDQFTEIKDTFERFYPKPRR